MPTLTPGNNLYFYQLFSAELGVGKQTPIARVGEVLAEADVALEDVDCESVEQLVEALSAFLKVTTFKKGRVFVTVMANEEYDTLLEKAEQATAEKGESGARAWKRARRTKVVRPMKPRPKRKPVVEAPVEAEEAAVAAVEEPTVEPAAEAEVTATPEVEAIEAPVENEPQVEVVVEAEATPEPELEPVSGPEPEPALEPEAISEPEPEAEPEPEPEVASAAEPEDSPEAEAKPEPEAAPKQAEVPTSRPRDPKRVHTTPKLHRISLPETISEDVYCPSDLLRQLYQALPPAVGIMEALDEGWGFAREAGTIEGTRSRLTFPLSRTGRPGHPIEVTIARAARIPSGKSWQLVEVDTDESEDDDPSEEA